MKRVLIVLLIFITSFHISLIFWSSSPNIKIEDAELEGDIVVGFNYGYSDAFLISNGKEIEELDNNSIEKIKRSSKSKIEASKKHEINLKKNIGQFKRNNYSINPTYEYAILNNDFGIINKHIYILNIVENKKEVITIKNKNTDYINDFAWSPDGKKIALLISDINYDYHQILIILLKNMNTINNFQLESKIYNKIAWSPDSKKIATVNIKYKKIFCPINLPAIFSGEWVFNYCDYNLEIFNIATNELSSFLIIEKKVRTNIYYKQLIWIE